ncbi:lycopene cyclase domain-containing protein [Salinirarus marinus]|uniref:lycopene cyclase domain-containing protein n=1 Tax=Salinirarus marinus TaxID=3068310 RepID=UPI003C6C87F9
MSLSRHGRGIRKAAGAFASQVHPVFMLPPLAASAFGGVLAPSLAPSLAALHAAGVFCAVYTAHVKDGYVDFYVRGEDDEHPLTRTGCRLGLVGATAGFGLATTALGLLVGWGAALVTVPCWLLGYFHAPQLDTHPLTATAGYPVGVGVSLLGGYYAQVTALSPAAVSLAAVFVVVLSGIKIVDDETDYAYDRSIDKRTVAVVLGRRRARRLAYALMAAGMVAVVALSAASVLPSSAAIAVVPFAVVAVVARRAGAGLATMLLVRATYLFFAVLVVAVRFRPLSPLPDISVLGPYTYLATEVTFGVVAVALLAYARAFRAAARTVVVLYPVAYVWDWYTLRVGVFAIPLRTGVELLGIPIEEHLFMVVVPALVVGVHEALATLDD